mgnify:CR=1 FL=1
MEINVAKINLELREEFDHVTIESLKREYSYDNVRVYITKRGNIYIERFNEINDWEVLFTGHTSNTTIAYS